MSQKERVREYLEKHGTITSFECFTKLRIVDLQRAIFLLRKEEYNITDEWVNNGKSKYKIYRLERENGS